MRVYEGSAGWWQRAEDLHRVAFYVSGVAMRPNDKTREINLAGMENQMGKKFVVILCAEGDRDYSAKRMP